MPNSSAWRDRVPRRLRELLGLVALAGHRRERALGDVARELAQRGLVFGVGERDWRLGLAPDAGADMAAQATGFAAEQFFC